MRKYRCPCCGRECIPTLLKIYSTFQIGRRGRVNSAIGETCPDCGGRFIIKHRQPVGTLMTLAQFAIVLLAFSGALWLTFNGYPFFALSPLVLMTFFYYTIPLANLMYPIVKRNTGDGLLLYDIPEGNARVKFGKPRKKLRPLDIYGAKFDRPTENVRFHETFMDGMVPIVILKEPKWKGQPNVQLMKREFVPDELLAPGALFTVYDNGRAIVRGRIEKTFED